MKIPPNNIDTVMYMTLYILTTMWSRYRVIKSWFCYTLWIFTSVCCNMAVDMIDFFGGGGGVKISNNLFMYIGSWSVSL